VSEKRAIIRVIDVEASGDRPDADEAGLVEIGYTDVVANGVDLAGLPCDWEVVDGKSTLCHPGSAITPETSAVHNIIDADVAGLPNWKQRLRPLIRGLRDDGVIAVAGHSVEFEALWIHPEWWGEQGPLPFVCTYKTALRVWPDAPTHSNAGLRYLRMPSGLDRAKASPHHRAGPDSYVTAFHVRDLLNEGTPLEQMIEWTKLPALTVRCYLRDYRNGGKGTKWEDVDTGLINWIVNIADFSDKPDILYTAQYHLEKRRAEEDQERERQDLNAQLRANGMDELPPIAGDTAAPVANPNQGALL
jgi:exodeoxyribonuclease X